MNALGKGLASAARLQRVQVCQQIVDLLGRKDIAEAVHLVSAEHNDVTNTIVICWDAAHAQVWLLKDSFRARSLASAR